MPPLPGILINGHYYSWASIEVDANGLPLKGIRSINYNDSLTPGKPRGTHPVHLGRTRGQYEAAADMELYRNDFEDLKLTQLGGAGFMERSFALIVQYAEVGLPPIRDTIAGVRITKVEVSNSDSTDASMVKLTLDVLLPILWNGVPAVAPI